MTILLSYSIGPVHDPKHLHFKDPLDLNFDLRQVGATPQNLSCAPKTPNGQFCPQVLGTVCAVTGCHGAYLAI